MIMLDLAHRQKMFDDETAVAWSVSIALDYTLHHGYALSHYGVYRDGGKDHIPNGSLYSVSRYISKVTGHRKGLRAAYHPKDLVA